MDVKSQNHGQVSFFLFLFNVLHKAVCYQTRRPVPHLNSGHACWSHSLCPSNVELFEVSGEGHLLTTEEG